MFEHVERMMGGLMDWVSRLAEGQRNGYAESLRKCAFELGEAIMKELEKQPAFVNETVETTISKYLLEAHAHVAELAGDSKDLIVTVSKCYSCGRPEVSVKFG